jgi:hypothetical protein
MQIGRLVVEQLRGLVDRLFSLARVLRVTMIRDDDS